MAARTVTPKHPHRLKRAFRNALDLIASAVLGLFKSYSFLTSFLVSLIVIILRFDLRIKIEVGRIDATVGRFDNTLSCNLCFLWGGTCANAKAAHSLTIWDHLAEKKVSKTLPLSPIRHTK